MIIRNRRQGREAALRALYAIDIGGASRHQVLTDLQNEAKLPGDVFEFASRLLEGCQENQNQIDTIIRGRLLEWTLERLAPVDRNLIRLGVFELYFCPEIPPAVTLDEAVEIAKKYSSIESGKFVNGVLGRILEDSPKWNWSPPKNAEIEERSLPEPEAEVEEVELNPESEEAAKLAKIGVWKLRSENPE